MKTIQYIIAVLCVICALSTSSPLTGQSIETQGTLDIRMNSTSGTPHILIEEVDASSGGSTRVELRNSNNLTDKFELRSFLHPSVSPTLGWYYNNSPFLLWDEDKGGLSIDASTINQKLNVGGAINIGNTTTNTNGSIRYTGSDFEGYSGGSWTSLSDNGPWTSDGPRVYFTFAGFENVGIGTSSPSSKLHIQSTSSSGTLIRCATTGNLSSSAAMIRMNMGSGSSDNAEYITCNRTGSYLSFNVEGDGSVSAGNEKFRVVGSTGDVYITDSSAGVILTSPNGNCWRMTIDNSGVPSYTNVSCP